jgi:transcription elongation factor Elf1
MNPTYKEYVFDFADLKLFSFVCTKCQSETILDLTEASRRSPGSCPACGEEFGPVFTEALMKYYDIYRVFTDKQARVKSRIRIRREVNVAEF